MAENMSGPSPIGMGRGMAGMTLLPIQDAGIALWVPDDWYKMDMNDEHQGVLFSPYKDDFNTCFLFEKRTLRVLVTKEDADALREGFNKGLLGLPGIQVLSTDETLAEKMQMFDAIYTFMEGNERRQRWMRCLYWGYNQLILIAQGRSAEDFERWLPLFYKTMTTPQLRDAG